MRCADGVVVLLAGVVVLGVVGLGVVVLGVVVLGVVDVGGLFIILSGNSNVSSSKSILSSPGTGWDGGVLGGCCPNSCSMGVGRWVVGLVEVLGVCSVQGHSGTLSVLVVVDLVVVLVVVRGNRLFPAEGRLESVDGMDGGGPKEENPPVVEGAFEGLRPTDSKCVGGSRAGEGVLDEGEPPETGNPLEGEGPPKLDGSSGMGIGTNEEDPPNVDGLLPKAGDTPEGGGRAPKDDPLVVEVPGDAAEAGEPPKLVDGLGADPPRAADPPNVPKPLN